MNLFRINRKALEFFDSKYKDIVKPLSYWEENHIPKKALEHVKNVWVTYGIQTAPNLQNLARWSIDGEKGENQAELKFTLNAIGIDRPLYNRMTKEDSIIRLEMELEAVFSNHIDFLRHK